MFKKFTISILIISVLFSFFLVPAFFAEESEVERINYYYYLRNKEGTTAKLTNAPASKIVPSNINDNDLSSIAQIEYTGAYNSETGLLDKSIYLVLDLGGSYSLKDISIKWYPTSKRCVKYIIEGSADDVTYTTIADHSDNVSIYDTIVDDELDVKARYLRIEILGNFRESDETRNGFFVISELTVNGVLDKNEPRLIPYSVDVTIKEGADGVITQPSIGVYPTEHLYDRDTSSLYEIQYSGAYKSDGTLEHPYYMVLDLGDVYTLDSFWISPYLNVKGLKFKVAVSEDNITYSDCFDYSDNSQIAIIEDSFDDVKGRYIRFEIFGNFKSDGTYNTYTYISELAVFGYSTKEEPKTEFTPQNPKIDYTYNLSNKDGATGNLTFTNAPNLNQVPENLKDGDLSTIAQIVYTGEYGEDLLKDSFYLVLDLGSVHDLEALLVKWYPTSKRCVKYIVSVSEDGENYTEALDYSTNTTMYDTITGDLTGLSGRFVRFEILGNYRNSDQTRNGYFVISEIELYGAKKDIPNPKTYDLYSGYILTFMFVVASAAVVVKKCTNYKLQY
jgi:hypothetical protein